jgi:hypothetical protein
MRILRLVKVGTAASLVVQTSAMSGHHTLVPCGLIASDVAKQFFAAFGIHVLPRAVNARQILTCTLRRTLLDSG